MSDKFRESSIVHEIRRLFIEHGFDEAQTDLIIHKLRTELSENLDVSNNRQARLSLSERLAYLITTMKVGHGASPELFKARYDHNYNIVTAVLGAAIFEALLSLVKFIGEEIAAGVQFIGTETAAGSDKESFLVSDSESYR